MSSTLSPNDWRTLMDSDDWRERASVHGWNEYGGCRAGCAIPYVAGTFTHARYVHIKHGVSGKTLLELSAVEARRLAIALLATAEAIDDAFRDERRAAYAAGKELAA